MNFTKYHIAGKDYIYCSEKNNFDNLTEAAVKAICDRHKGIGTDGIFTFDNICPKTSNIRGFNQIGKCMRDFSSASICTFFETVLSSDITERTFLSANGQKTFVKTDFSANSHAFSCTLQTCTEGGIFSAVGRKTEIGNRILTLTPVYLHSIYTVHFTDCKERLNSDYLGQHISENSLFGKEASLILAEYSGKNSFNIDFYENSTGCPRPEISAFGATALAACRNDICKYGETISVSCNDSTVSIICSNAESVTIKCTCEKVFEGKI